MQPPSVGEHIEWYDDMTLPDHLAWQLVSFDRCTWPNFVDDALPWGPRPYAPERAARHVVAVAGKVLLGAATVLRVSGRLAHTRLAIDGIGSVFTFPARRGAGIGRTLMTAATQLADEGDADVAVLFCAPERQRFYAACGWELAPALTYVGAESAHYRQQRMSRSLSPRARELGTLLLTQPLHVDRAW